MKQEKLDFFEATIVTVKEQFGNFGIAFLIKKCSPTHYQYISTKGNVINYWPTTGSVYNQTLKVKGKMDHDTFFEKIRKDLHGED